MSFHDTENPKGGVNMEHVIEEPDPDVNLLERILSRENMRQAWKRVKANKGVAGVDGMSIDNFPRFAHEHWTAIRQTVLDGTYKPKPVLRVEIPKATGERPVEHVPYAGHTGRHDKQMAQESRFAVHQGNVGEHSLSGYGPIVFVKRPVRTRTQGVVGSGG